MRCCMVHCPGDCHLVRASTGNCSSHCTEACDGILPLDEAADVQKAYLVRVQAAEARTACAGLGRGVVAGPLAHTYAQRDEHEEDEEEDDDGDDDDDDEDEDDDGEGDEEDDGVEEGIGRVWRTVQCDRCGCHPRQYFYHRAPNTDLCKSCFHVAPGVPLPELAAGPESRTCKPFLRVTRGCPYGGGIRDATLVYGS